MTYASTPASLPATGAELQKRSQIGISCAPRSQSAIALTLFTNDGGRALTKTIRREEGRLVKQAAAEMAAGRFEQITLADIEDFAAFLDRNRRRHDRAVCFGVPKGNPRGRVASAAAIRDGKAPGAIARTLDHWEWRDGAPGIFFGDIDPGPACEEWGVADFDAAICDAAPWIAPVRRFYVPSASSEIYDSATDKRLSPKTGLHLYFALDDASRAKAVGEALFVALFEAGHGWIALSKSGALLRRTIIDAAVWQAQRLDFFAEPILGPGLERRHSAIWFGEQAMLRAADAPGVTMDEWRRSSSRLKQLETAIRPQVDATATAWVSDRVKDAEARGVPRERARAIYRAAVHGGKLYRDFQLHTPDGRRLTVGEALADPRTWDRAVICDPLEPDYGSRDCAMLFLLDQKDGPMINSFAHGGACYALSSAEGPDEGPQPPSVPLSAYENDLRQDRDTRGAERQAEREAFTPPMILEARELRQTKAPERRWLIADLVPADDVTLLGGDGASGKTTLCFQLGTAMEAGLLFLGKPVAAGPVLYLTAEESACEVAIRAEMAASHTRVVASLHDFRIASLADREEPALIVVDRNGKVRTTPMFDWVRSEASRTKARLIILDAVADFIAVDEINRQQVRAAVAKLRKLCIDLDLAVILIAHPSVDGMKTGRGYSGSTHWNNAVRSRLYLTQPSGGDGEADHCARVLEHKKTNRGALQKPIPLRFISGRYEVDSSALRKSISGDAEVRARFLELLRIHNKQMITVSAASGRNYAPKVFSAHIDSGGITKAAFTKAMQGLMNDGVIDHEKVGKGTREKLSLVIVE